MPEKISRVRDVARVPASPRSKPARRPDPLARTGLVLLATCFFALAAAAGARAQLVVDDFVRAVPQIAPPNSEIAAAVVGGHRDVKSNSASNSAAVDGHRFTCAGTAAFQGCTVQFDGDDDDPVTFTPGGFAAMDFTAGGGDRFDIRTFNAMGACNLFVEICDDDLPEPQCDSLSTGGIVNGATVTYFFDDFELGLDFTQITALQVNLTPTSAPVNCSIGALRVSGTLIFADGFESADALAWS